MASLYTYRPQTFGLVFVIARVPYGKMKYTSPEYLCKAEVQNVTHCDSMVGFEGRGWCCSQRYLPGFASCKKWTLEKNTIRDSVRKTETQQLSKLSALHCVTTLLLLCIFLWTLVVLEYI